MTKKASSILEKLARIMGDTISDYSVVEPHPGISSSDRMRELATFYKNKAREPKTSWGKALGMGAGIGASTGALLGTLIGVQEKAPALGAVLGAGFGAAVGTGISIPLKAVDDYNIQNAQRIMNSSNSKHEIKKNLLTLIRRDQQRRDLDREIKHLELISTIKKEKKHD